MTFFRLDWTTPMLPKISRLNLSLPWPLPTRNADENISMILQDFLSDHDMFSKDYPSICAVNEDLEAFMKREIDLRHLPAAEMNKTLHLAASLVELAYYDCTFSEKKHVALWLWYLIYIDDTSPDDTTDYVAFEERFLRAMPQLNPVLDEFALVLWAMFDFYPVPFANSIINTTFEYISGTCIEPAVKKLQLSGASPRFPWFLRARTGLGVGFALSLFPKSRQVDYVSCFQAMPDMDFWISASNDLLSYYKERLAGETANYISNRATVEAKSPLLITSDIRRELLESRNHIYEALEEAAGQDAIKAWRCWEHGYITWHLQQKRYRLDDLAF